MAAALARPGNLFGELLGPKNDKKSIPFSSSPSCIKYKRVNMTGSATMKCKDLSFSHQKSDFDDRMNSKLQIRGESVAVFNYKEIEEEEEEEELKERISEEELNRWIEQSIQEIVKNSGEESPFLMQIFAQGSSSLKLKKEEASPHSWPNVKRKWKESKSTPDGIILVQELKDEEATCDEASFSNRDDGSGCKRWGLVVQGRGMECAASCYVLNTCRVKSTAGFCTHFCLVRAKCFGESLDKQLSQTWLHGR